MKKSLFCSVLAGSTLALGASVLAPGGVSMDFARLKPLEKKAAEGPNLLVCGDFADAAAARFDLAASIRRKGWGGVFYVHGGTPEEKKTFPAFGVRKLQNGAALIQSLRELQKRRDAQGRPMFSNRINQIFAVPAANHPRTLRIAMTVSGRIEPAAGLNAFIGFADALKLNEKGRLRQVGKNVQKTLPVTSSPRAVAYDLVVPAGAEYVSISLALYGVGEIVLDDVSAKFVDAPAVPDVLAYPAGMLDNLFAAGSKQPATVAFVFRNDTGRKLQNLRLRLQLPEGFHFVDAHMWAKVVKNSGGEVVLDWSRCPIRPGGFETWYTLPVLLDNTLPAGAGRYPLRYSVIENGQSGPVKTLDLQVVPAACGTTPKVFRTGCQFAHEDNFAGPGAEPFARYYRELGFNVVHGGSSRAVQEAFGRAGITRYTQPHMLCNGYRLGTGKKVANELFTFVDGAPAKDGSLCPELVGQDGEAVRKYIDPAIREALAKAEVIMPNWELHNYDFKGCFCVRCREAFVRCMQGRAAPEAVCAAWPGKVIASYRADWVRFRSLQHAKLMKVLRSHIVSIGSQMGKKSEFVPELAWSSFIEADREKYAQYDPRDYLADIPWVDPWGPYIFHNAENPYEYYPGLHLITHMAADAIRKNAPRSKLIAMPHGVQCGTWFTEPEAVAFEFLTFFVNRWEGAIGYYYPKGYDARHLAASAAANSAIARYEGMVLGGRDISNRVSVKAETPVPTPFFPAFWSEGGNFTLKLPALKNSSVVQARAFEKDGRFVVALGNFWQKGEVFGRVSLSGLKPAAKYRVTLDDTALGDFTGAELGKGILAHAGALRWSFLTIQPAVGAAPKALSQQEIQTEMTKRLPAIRKACAWENAYAAKYREAASSDVVENDFKAFYPIQNGAVDMKAGTSTIDVVTPSYRASVDPAAGGRIVSLKSASGEELSIPGPKFGLGQAGFWKPAAMIGNGFKIVGAKAEGGNVALTLERTLSPRDSREGTGLKLLRKYVFGADRIALMTTVENTTAKPVSFSFRYRSFPAGLSSRNGVSGAAVFGDGKRFERDFKVRLASFAAPDKRVDGAYRMEQVLPVKSANVTFAAPFLKASLTGSADAETLQCMVFWDGDGPGAPYEPIYRHTLLAPGSCATFQAGFSVKQQPVADPAVSGL